MNHNYVKIMTQKVNIDKKFVKFIIEIQNYEICHNLLISTFYVIIDLPKHFLNIYTNAYIRLLI